LENAPYSEIVRRLGEASIGLNTMQDEHFGINVVEFMVSTLFKGRVGADSRLLD
jgi:alpha-1,2-mannosyltransferase